LIVIHSKDKNIAMKKLPGTILIIVLTILGNGCTGGGTTHGTTDTAAATTDTMPVVHPQNMDSGSTIRTPPINDSNAIMPDSAIKNK
jgi:hypothetical protein